MSGRRSWRRGSHDGVSASAAAIRALVRGDAVHRDVYVNPELFDSPVGRLEVAGAPLRFMHDSHWKMFVENLNDTMHPMVAHEFSAGTARDPWREQPPDEEIIPAASAKMAAAAKQVPVGRFGKPHDVARAVAFFSDPKASFVTGQTLFVCGGTSVGSIVY